uniref:Uncharacterized protein n=1 Tax=Oryza sativa subsp. japonica TaxID=39947 RepID=Q53PK9_ORYSJ|nr:hypothetical protein [Oryza sativa Japonica Group]
MTVTTVVEETNNPAATAVKVEEKTAAATTTTTTTTQVDKKTTSGEEEKPKPVVTYRYICENIHRLDRNDPFFFTWGMRNETAYAMCLLSLLYAVLSLCLLLPWQPIPTEGDGDHPLINSIWTFSLLALSYMFCWIISLSEAITKLVAFTSITYGILMAFAVAHLLGRVVGMAVIVIAVLYTTGMFAHAIAEHRQHTGSDTAADALLTKKLTTEQMQREELRRLPFIVLGAYSLFVFGCTAWLVFTEMGSISTATVIIVLAEVSIGTCFISYLWSILLSVGLLHDTFVSHDTIVFKAGSYSIALYFLAFLLIAMFESKLLGLSVLLLIPMAMAGFLGYLVAVYSHYKSLRVEWQLEVKDLKYDGKLQVKNPEEHDNN